MSGSASRHWIFFLSAPFLAGLSLPAFADATNYRLIALSGEEAVGIGLPFWSVGSASIGGDGQVTFEGQLTNANGVGAGSGGGIWQASSSGVSLIAGTSTPAPGLPPGWTLAGFQPALTNGQGQIAFDGSATLMNGTTLVATTTGIWTGTSAADLHLVAQQGESAPGTGGASFDSFVQTPVVGGEAPVSLTDSGDLGFSVTLQGPGITNVDQGGIWTSSNATAASTTLLARNGDVAPGGGGALWGIGANRHELNSAGQVAFVAGLSSGSSGLWTSDATGGFAMLEKFGDPAVSVPGGTYGTSKGYSINPSGDVAFDTDLKSSDGSTHADGGLWDRSATGATALVARQGQVMPGAGGATFSTIFAPAVLPDHSVVFMAQSTFPASSLWRWTAADGLTRLAEVDALPTDIPGGVAEVDWTLSQAAANDKGDIVFRALIFQNSISSHRALYEYDAASGKTQVVLTEGQPFTVAPGDVRTISSFDLWGTTALGPTMSNIQDGTGTAFNDNDQLAVDLTFTDHSTGVFEFNLPEPTSAALLFGAVPLFIRRRRKAA